MKLCSFEGCSNPKRTTGLCLSHYSQRRRGRDLTPIGTGSHSPESSLRTRFWLNVDKTDSCWSWAGAKTVGYGRIHHTVGGSQKRGLAHRISYEWTNGPIPEGLVIDHKCHNAGCVNPSHLQAVTQKQNVENLSGPAANNTSGITGVWWSHQANKWIAAVFHQGRRHHVGTFADLGQAERAVVTKRNELFTNNLRDRVAS